MGIVNAIYEIKKMKSTGFSGFESIQSLINNDCINVPDEKGIYFVLKDIGKVEFLKASIGGHFKGKDRLSQSNY